MKVTLLPLLAFLISACAAPMLTPSPSDGSPPTASAATIAIDCGSFSGDIPNCLLIVEAAAREFEPVAGSRAQVSNDVGLARCPNPSPCPELAVGVRVAQVRFISPGGDRVTVDVLSGAPPPGGYFGVILAPLRSP